MTKSLSRAHASAALGTVGCVLHGSLCAAAAPVEDIRDIRGPKLILPGWAWPAIIAAVVVLALCIYWLWRAHRRRRARVLTPFEIAVQGLEEIRTLMLPGSAREFSTAVSDIVRTYIEKRFDITATRRTTEEFLRDLLESSNASLASHRTLLGEFLHQCDVVKFAAMSLTIRDMESLRQSARAFVLATAKPEEALAVQEGHDSLSAA
ncbi:MAG TPA: DUF4381 family protein [Steroidobacteraceae bacterium]|jgi:hypothetical protein